MSHYSSSVSGSGTAAADQSLSLVRWLADAGKSTVESRVAVGGKPPTKKEKIVMAGRAIDSFEKAMKGTGEGVEKFIETDSKKKNLKGPKVKNNVRGKKPPKENHHRKE